jgi:hypothetical protein
MEQIRIVAIPTKVAESVRATMLAPGYGFPARSELGAESCPLSALPAVNHVRRGA